MTTNERHARVIEQNLKLPAGSVNPDEISFKGGVTTFTLPPAYPTPVINKNRNANKEMARIVIEYYRDCPRSSVSNDLPRIEQAVMCRNPSDEPSVFCEVSKDKGETWERDDSI